MAYRSGGRSAPTRHIPRNSQRALREAIAATVRGDPEEAIRQYERLLSFHPADAAVQNDLANAYRSVWRIEDALRHYRQAVELNPTFTIARRNLGITLVDTGRFEEAIEQLQEALRLEPGHGPTMQAMILALARLGRGADAEPYLARIQANAEEAPDPDSLTNFALALTKLDRVEEAAALLARVQQLSPEDAEAHTLYGLTLLELARYPEALAALDRAVQQNPAAAEPRFYRSLELLRSGDFERGFAEYEWRWRHTGFTSPRPSHSQPLWDGARDADATILLDTEQGLGDAIQFVRFAPLVRERVGRVILRCEPALQRLFAGLPGVDEVVSKADALPSFDMYAPLLSLPTLLGTTLDDLPPAPYLRPLAAELSLPERRPGARLRVGVVWSGSRGHANDRARSIPLAALEKLLMRADLEVVSLQRGDGSEQLAGSPLCDRVLDLGNRFRDLRDTAAVMQQLDLVISVDTALAHLAGALGRPTWVMLPFNADWRWLTERDDSPWYDSVRLFRQETAGEWGGVVERMAAALAEVEPETESRFARALRHHLAGELSEAEALYRAALDEDAGLAAGWNNLGVIVRGRDGAPASLDYFRRAVELRSEYLDAQNNLGLALRQVGDIEGSIAPLRAVLRLEPDSPERILNLANSLLSSGQSDEAIELYQRALALRPDYAEALNNLGAAYRARREYAAAVPLLLRALEIEPDYLDALQNLALALPADQSADGVDRERILRAAAARNPTSARHRAMLAMGLQESTRFEEAAREAEAALALDDSVAEAWVVLGIASAEQQRYERAIECYRRAIQLDPDDPTAHWNLGLALLMRGEYAEGWREYEWRWKLMYMLPDLHHFEEPAWNGEPLDGRTLYLYTEQGLGDGLQFVRFVEVLKSRWSVRVVVETSTPLAELFRSCPSIDEVVVAGDAHPPFDFHSPLLSLPRILGVTLDNIPTEPYLQSEPRDVTEWIPACAELKVGLVWGGRASNPNLARRSLDLDLLAPLLQTPGVRFFSLQKGPQVAELATAIDAGRIVDLAPRLDDFRDTAAAVEALDLVITIDTSVAHLAGALGTPTWVLLMHTPDWRWLLEREDSPWYPSMHLFRQSTPGDWEGVVARAADALGRVVEENRPPEASHMDATLPAAQRSRDGSPRFNLRVPFQQIADPAGFAVFEAELRGIGVDVDTRVFLDDELRSGDALIDVGAGWGFRSLAAATAPGRAVRVVSIVGNAEEAALLRENARANPLTGSIEVLEVTDRTTLPIADLAPTAARVFLCVEDGADLPAIVARCAPLMQDGRLAAIAWPYRPASTDRAAAARDEIMRGGLSALGFSQFRMAEDDDGPLLVPLDPQSEEEWTVFSLPLAEPAQEQRTEPVLTPSAPTSPSGPVPVAFDWQLGAHSGWGVYGLNLAIHGPRYGILPCPTHAPDLRGLDPLQEMAIAEVLRNDRHGLIAPELRLHALGNHLSSIQPLNPDGAVGVVFMEDTALDAADIERGRRFARIVAGSTWNAELLESRGISDVAVCLQGVDPSVFHPAPRAGLLGDRFVVFSGGKLEYRKGQDLVVAAFREFQRRHEDALLVTAWHNHWPHTMAEIPLRGHVTGVPAVDGSRRLDVRGWLARNGIPAEAVLDLGLVPNALMGRMVREADVALFPNRCEGGTNLVAMECMASGIPVILSANTGHLDLTDESRCIPLLHQPQARASELFRGTEGWGESSVDEIIEALEFAYQERTVAAERGSAAARFLSNLSWERQIGALTASIADLL